MDAYHRVFEWNDQQHFARASCDFNPIHIDSVAARRTHSGAPIVHGIHTLIWALDCVAARYPDAADARTLKAQFPQPIYVGDSVTLEITRPKLSQIRTRAVVGTEEVMVATISLDAPVRMFPLLPPPAHSAPPPVDPVSLALSEMIGLHGELRFDAALESLSTTYPQAAATFGTNLLTALSYSSCLVGMVVPGLHSMYSGLDIAVCDDGDIPPYSLRYSVDSVVERFRLVRIGIAARGVRGSLETISRMPPVRQLAFDRLGAVVEKGEFRDCTALIVGGSRGVGELTAKLIAAGGGQTIVTYVAGKHDAQTLAKELTNAGAMCTTLHYDVRRPAAEQLATLRVTPTQLYYFATPPIFRRKSGLYDEQRFTEFNAFYVSGFFDLVHTLHSTSKSLRVFYPSSTALHERPPTMTEYTMSKAAGEVLCADLCKFAHMNILVRRLPRLPTDQTNSVVPVQTPDPIAVMLPIVREMQAPLQRQATQ